MMSKQVYYGFDKFNDFERVKMEEIKSAFFDKDKVYEDGAHIPNGCYINYGNDLDGCSTQQEEGCKRCILYRK